MGIEELRDLLPRYVTGSLPEEDMLRVSQALAGSPGGMDELRFTLLLRQAAQPEQEPLPAFPNLTEQGETAPSLVPRSLHNSLALLRGAAGVTRGAIRTALNFL